jgi:LacI family transcriptional regulator
MSIAITRGVPDREAAALAMFARQNVDALIYATIQTREVDPFPVPFEAQTVLLNCYRADKAWPSVVPDEFGGGYVATKRLIETGAQRIAHIHGQAWMDAASDRLRGYQRALREFGLEFDPLLVRPGNWEPAAGYEQTMALLDLEDPPTAIFCANDLTAIGCYEALKERGLRIPGDVSVVGYDDREIALQMRPPLTTVLLPHYEMGARAAEIALAETSAQPGSVIVDCPLIERESALPPR